MKMKMKKVKVKTDSKLLLDFLCLDRWFRTFPVALAWYGNYLISNMKISNDKYMHSDNFNAETVTLPGWDKSFANCPTHRTWSGQFPQAKWTISLHLRTELPSILFLPMCGLSGHWPHNMAQIQIEMAISKIISKVCKCGLDKPACLRFWFGSASQTWAFCADESECFPKLEAIESKVK